MSRPPFYNTPEEMQEAVDKYFTDCRLTWNDSNQLPNYPTVTGLGLALGFSGRQSILNYNEKPEFVDTIKKARSRIEEFNEQRLYGGQVTGVIFNLKNNFGWKDAQDHNIGGQPDGIPASLTINWVKPSDKPA